MMPIFLLSKRNASTNNFFLWGYKRYISFSLFSFWCYKDDFWNMFSVCLFSRNSGTEEGYGFQGRKHKTYHTKGQLNQWETTNLTPSPMVYTKIPSSVHLTKNLVWDVLQQSIQIIHLDLTWTISTSKKTGLSSLQNQCLPASWTEPPWWILKSVIQQWLLLIDQTLLRGTQHKPGKCAIIFFLWYFLYWCWI